MTYTPDGDVYVNPDDDSQDYQIDSDYDTYGDCTDDNQGDDE